MILVIDNYDSFTYNLVQYLGQCGADPVVYRNDAITVADIERMRPEGIMLSPGPCTPDRSGVCLDIARAAITEAPWASVPLFGVCLGHQAIGQAGGGKVNSAGRVMHGKTSPVRHNGLDLFEGMPNPFRAVRYHSLVVGADSVPPGFEVTATAEDDGEIMGLRHERLPIFGVQFHPESVLTESGLRIAENFLRIVEAANSRRAV